MALSGLTKLAVFKFESNTNCWRCEASEGHGKNNFVPNDIPSSLCRIATLNVLSDTFPGIVELAIKSPQRLEAYTKGYTPKGLPEAKPIHPLSDIGADILALNEVSLNIAKALFVGQGEDVMSSSGYRYMTFYGATFYVTAMAASVPVTLSELLSHLLKEKSASSTHSHGCVIVSKYPITQARKGETTREVYADILAPSVGGGSATPLIVCSRHTTAYATAETKAQRASQIKLSSERCRLLCQQHHNKDSEAPEATFVLLGDLNLHDTNEDKSILDNALIDTFAAVNEERLVGKSTDQFTFSPSTNPMIKRYIPAEDRHMRLDRILFPQEGYWSGANGTDRDSTKYFFASSQKLWAEVPIDVPGELTLSDHFGLCVDIGLLPPGSDFSALEPRLKSIAAEFNNAFVEYPGKTGLEARAALPSDQCNRRAGMIANAMFISKVTVNIAVYHLPWVLSQYWARYRKGA
eukprot:GILI01012021.1.p1 GENE.GILI01012021.1~~GILI01012021.1.p1  ORF type:complete len:465 (-),score=50.16 GILI01012021.1:69-1463(-)